MEGPAATQGRSGKRPHRALLSRGRLVLGWTWPFPSSACGLRLSERGQAREGHPILETRAQAQSEACAYLPHWGGGNRLSLSGKGGRTLWPRHFALSGNPCSLKDRTRSVPGFFSGRGSEGTSGSSICSYKKEGRGCRTPPGREVPRAEAPAGAGTTETSVAPGGFLGDLSCKPGRALGQTYAHGPRSHRSARCARTRAGLWWSCLSPRGPLVAWGIRVLGRKDIRRQRPRDTEVHRAAT